MSLSAGVFLNDVFHADGLIAPEGLVRELHITMGELAVASGLSRDAVSKSARLKAPTTQARLRDIVEIINRVLPWAGSAQRAFAWYRAQPLPSFGDLTAEDLVKAGESEAVKAYLSRIAAGGYARGSRGSSGAPTIRDGHSRRHRRRSTAAEGRSLVAMTAGARRVR